MGVRRADCRNLSSPRCLQRSSLLPAPPDTRGRAWGKQRTSKARRVFALQMSNTLTPYSFLLLHSFSLCPTSLFPPAIILPLPVPHDLLLFLSQKIQTWKAPRNRPTRWAAWTWPYKTTSLAREIKSSSAKLSGRDIIWGKHFLRASHTLTRLPGIVGPCSRQESELDL